ncbi:unnamed protein product [Heligmosomoides polygyrus]|uniref:Uncharacterized protein n=1 Tax=Heligmosomoides polygyrus TaxID=6339 RepID=A0A183GEX2_HELPZ|nr:unnamed protein product [Heligmosomoides polygyrus]
MEFSKHFELQACLPDAFSFARYRIDKANFCRIGSFQMQSTYVAPIVQRSVFVPTSIVVSFDVGHLYIATGRTTVL